MTRWRARHRGSPADRGAAAVEFAIVLVVLLLIIFAIIDFGRLLFAWQSMKAASREGARTAVVASGNGQTVTTAVNNAGATAAALAGGTLTRQYAINNAALAAIPNDTTDLCTTAGSAITIRVATGFKWFTPVGIFASNVNQVDASTTMRCE